MVKKILIIETSLRAKSNSDRLAESFAEGAKAAGNDVEIISMKGKNIGFCTGCFGCQKLGHCVFKDDANEITEKILEAEVVVWSTPIYYYEMSGQMKTMIDRANSLYSRDYKFREVQKYNSDDYIGKTSAEIIEEYGKFDYESVLKDKVGYIIVTRRNKESFLH